MWSRIGSRCGPGKDRPVPKTVPTDWNDDRGAFIEAVPAVLTHEQIAERAYLLWERCGGMYSEQECWLMAENALKQMNWTYGRIVWRRGKWEKRRCKVSKQEEIDFFFYGPGYSDYECTQVIVEEKDFNGAE